MICKEQADQVYRPKEREYEAFIRSNRVHLGWGMFFWVLKKGTQ
jgi:hypothetical protein